MGTGCGRAAITSKNKARTRTIRSPFMKPDNHTHDSHCITNHFYTTLCAFAPLRPCVKISVVSFVPLRVPISVPVVALVPPTEPTYAIMEGSTRYKLGIGQRK